MKSFYLLRNHHTNLKISQIIDEYGLAKSYESKNEKIYKNETFLISVKPRYVFLEIMSPHSTEQQDLAKLLRM